MIKNAVKVTKNISEIKNKSIGLMLFQAKISNSFSITKTIKK
jgi:hypothetical protein